MSGYVIAFLLGVNLTLFGPGIVHYWRHRTEPLSAKWLWLVLVVVVVAAFVETV